MSRLVTVHWGPVWEVALLEGRLTQDGIPCLMPDGIAPRIEAVVTGVGALATRLLVPEEHADRAAVLVEEYLAAVKSGKELTNGPDVYEHADDEDE